MSSSTFTESPSVRESASPGIRRIARLGGAAYLAMFVLAIVANFLVLEQMVVDSDPVATQERIAASPGVFLVGIVAFGVIAVLDVFLAWVLYRVFGSVQRRLARVMAAARVVYSIFLAVGIGFLVLALRGATGDPAGAQQVMADVDTFTALWLVGLAVFGLHLVLLGVLVIRSGFAPRPLGLILMLAGVAYGLDTIARFALADYESVAPILVVFVAVTSMVGEGWMGVWLLVTRRLPGSSKDK